MILRRKLLAMLGANFIFPLTALSQPSPKIARLGFLSSENAVSWAPRVEAFRAGLRELGYVEGKNIVIEFRWADGKYDRLPALAADLVRLNVDVIVAGAILASRTAKAATTTIPIVMTAVGDAVEQGLVTSLARPGGNVTGSSFFNSELAAKRIELVRDAMPRAKSVGVLLNPANPGAEPMLRAMEKTASALKINLQSYPVHSRDDFGPAFARLAKARVDAVVVPNQAMLNANAAHICRLADEHHVTSSGDVELAVAGCMLGYGTSFPELYHRAAAYVDKILKGAKPGDLPIERATKFELVVNLKAAKALGMNVPDSLRLLADKVIE